MMTLQEGFKNSVDGTYDAFFAASSYDEIYGALENLAQSDTRAIDKDEFIRVLRTTIGRADLTIDGQIDLWDHVTTLFNNTRHDIADEANDIAVELGDAAEGDAPASVRHYSPA